MNVYIAVQVSGCGECLVLSLLQEGSMGTACVRWEQVDDLLSLVVELKEEVKRLRSIWDCEREIDWWSHAQPSLQEAHRGDALQAVGDRLLSPSQVGEGELRDSEVWKQVPVWGSEGTASHPVPLPIDLTGLVQLVLLENAGLAKSRVRTLSFRRSNFWLLVSFQYLMWCYSEEGNRLFM